MNSFNKNRDVCKNDSHFINLRCLLLLIFISLFPLIDFNEIVDYLDIFEDDAEAYLIKGLIYSKSEDQYGQKEAANNFKKSVDNGNEYAMIFYGLSLEYGLGIDINLEEGSHYYKKAL